MKTLQQQVTHLLPHQVAISLDNEEINRLQFYSRVYKNLGMDYKYLFKIILVGDAGVGKTAMVRRFTKGFFPFQEAPTIGVDMSVKTVTIDGEKVKVSSRLYLDLILKTSIY